MDKDEAAANRVQEILGELKVTKTGQRAQEMAVHIRGMDALTTKQDIIVAVEKKIGPLTGKSCKLSDLRPNLGNTLAATLVLNKEDAGRLAEERTVRIGYVSCQVEKRIEMKRCFKCWAYSHKSKDCKSDADKSKACYRCGEDGHTARACKKVEDFCPVCGEDGHKADTRKCLIFRRALMRAREAERSKDITRKTQRTLLPQNKEINIDEPGEVPELTSLPGTSSD